MCGRLQPTGAAVPTNDQRDSGRPAHRDSGRACYEAIGEPHNRHRKPTPLGAAIERLMLLDAVLDTPTIAWLATERDKIAYFTRLLGTRLLRDELPSLTFGAPGKTTVR